MNWLFSLTKHYGLKIHTCGLANLILQGRITNYFMKFPHRFADLSYTL